MFFGPALRAFCGTSIVLCALACGPESAWAQLAFESPPIDYTKTATSDRVARLQEAMDRGDVKLRYDEAHGYLRSVLERLEVPISSQMLVFSKTSFQQRLISPARPRALYFNDDVHIGWVQGGEVIEVSAADPRQGAIFYTLRQEPGGEPRFVRDRGQCLTCHASSRTADVPGHLVRSVYPDRSGMPHFGSGTFTTDHRSPFKDRWGGWYVTGTHGSQRHMGNVIAGRGEELDTERGANTTDLSRLLDVSPYLVATSDIVALMVLEHQTQAHNLITRAGFETRVALEYDRAMNAALESPADERSESTTHRIESVGNKLVDYLLFVDEFPLQEPVRGTSQFAAQFEARGPFDSHGRSLRQLDLNRRLMKYPCSYLIYSAGFDALPDPVKEYTYRRLFDILTGKAEESGNARLSIDDRTAILDILRETKDDLPDYWRVTQ